MPSMLQLQNGLYLEYHHSEEVVALLCMLSFWEKSQDPQEHKQ
jgi:hypothetical protein